MSDENKELSMREEMEAAVSQFEEETEPTGDEYVEETPEVEAPQAQSPENGDITAEQPENPEQPAEQPNEQPSGNDSVKAPQSWSPKLREQFSKLPPEIQAQVNKRETEISRSLNEGAEHRKMGERFNQMAQPYQAVMAAHGTNDPVQAFKGLMDTAATLQGGSPQQKAQKLAEMVQYYGVDITALDNALSGQPNADPQTSALEQMLEQKLAPMQQFMNGIQQNQQQSQQQIQTEADNEVQQFEQSAEFIGDVRNDMADLLEMAAKQGREMSLQQAYDKACALNPEISSVLAQRAQNEKITGQQNNLQQKRNVASSISGRQIGTPSSGGGDSIADTLNQAWDDQLRG